MKITRVFFDVHMGMNFVGLNEIAKKAKTPVNSETTILFINKRMTAFKMLRDKEYIVYYRNGDKRIPIDALIHLPEWFGGDQIDFDKAIEKSLMEKMGK